MVELVQTVFIQISFISFNQRTALSVADYEKVFFEEVELDETNSAQFAGYENQDFTLVEIVDHQRRYSKVEK